MMSDLTATQVVERLRDRKFRFTDEDGCSWEVEPPPEHDALLSAWEDIVKREEIEGPWHSPTHDKALVDVRAVLEEE